MHAPILTILAAVAGSVVASPLETRAIYTWPATEVADKGNHIRVSINFRLVAPAGYVSGAPGFDVRCTPSILDQVKPVACTWNSQQGAGVSVLAEYPLANNSVAVTHIFGSQKVYGVSGNLNDRHLNTDFPINVVSVGPA